MGFWELFFRVLVRRPIRALEALYWHITRRKVRARNQLRIAAAELPLAYRLWIATLEKNASVGPTIEAETKNWGRLPKFTVLVEGGSRTEAAHVKATIASLQRQHYAVWNATVLQPASLAGFAEKPSDPRIRAADQDPAGAALSLAAAVAAAEGDYVIPVRAGNVLSEAALFRFAEALQDHPSAAVVYGDQDQLTAGGRRKCPWFKPEWNEEMFLALDYLSDAVAISAGHARRAVADGTTHHLDVHGLLLRVIAGSPGEIVHVPHILMHAAAPAPDGEGARLRELSRHLESSGATCASGPFGTAKVIWPLPAELPTVSVIVPTRDQLHLLRTCVDGVLNKTAYPAIELIVVDNASADPQTLSYLSDLERQPGVSVLRYPGPYNYAAINNSAAGKAAGSYLCLLNNDTEVLDENWLTEMMRYAVRPQIGAVGAKLLYGDGTIQHAGVVIGIGGAAGHAHRHSASDEAGYFRQAHVAQFVSAVTAACLVVEKEKFEEVGGLDAEHFAVAFNDVDFCLKLQAQGYRNVYVPHAVLLHHESKSRGSDAAPENLSRYMRELGVLQERWGTKEYADPLHNPNLDRSTESYIVRL